MQILLEMAAKAKSCNVIIDRAGFAFQTITIYCKYFIMWTPNNCFFHTNSIYGTCMQNSLDTQFPFSFVKPTVKRNKNIEGEESCSWQRKGPELEISQVFDVK